MSKPRVTQWIAEGKLTPPALIGEGISQRVDVELGMAQVEERRAADESYGLNGLDTNLEPPEPNLPVPQARESGAPRAPQVRVVPEGETAVTSEARIKAEKLRPAQFSPASSRSRTEPGTASISTPTRRPAGMTRVADEMVKISEGAALERDQFGADGGMVCLRIWGSPLAARDRAGVLVLRPRRTTIKID